MESLTDWWRCAPEMRPGLVDVDKGLSLPKCQGPPREVYALKDTSARVRVG